LRLQLIIIILILQVSRKQKKEDIVKYSSPCPHHFFCKKGKKCEYTHTDEEKAFFRSGQELKDKMCDKGPYCKRKKGIPCWFAHSNDDQSTFGCTNCKLRGHLETDCPTPK
jgi:hypothetical protein